MFSSITVITKQTNRAELKKIAGEGFGDMVKAVVDVNRSMMAAGGELHVDEEQVLLQNGSAQEDLWGINLYPDIADDSWIEFDSMINIRPRQNNRTRAIHDRVVQERIISVVKFLVLDA